MRRLLLLAAALAVASPAAAQTVEELKAELEAQKRINELLKQRIRMLESERAAAGMAPAEAAARPAPRPRREPREPEDDRALERALERRGTAVLPPFLAEVTPSVGWSHSGSDIDGSTSDGYVAALDGRIGLPGGWMIGVTVPYLHRDVSGLGENTGFGDVTLSVWKQLLAPDGAWPAVVGSVRYTAPTGEDSSDTPVALGSGFHRLTTQLSAVTFAAPMAFFASGSYTHGFERRLGGAGIEPADVLGVSAGASLAVTPDISVSTAATFAFADEGKRDGSKVAGSALTLGTVEVGAGIVLAKNLFVTVFGAFGVTDDSPDVNIGLSLPVRF